ncbi:hypothetical protein M2321_002867 [Rhodoblastus acidophilus]|nr:hypothetical protein [Rhodoblastus acidophilus]MCW2275282.1 hypothetical protein [Rhodoblastus acidophilus]
MRRVGADVVKDSCDIVIVIDDIALANQVLRKSCRAEDLRAA